MNIESLQSGPHKTFEYRSENNLNVFESNSYFLPGPVDFEVFYENGCFGSLSMKTPSFPITFVESMKTRILSVNLCFFSQIISSSGY